MKNPYAGQAHRKIFLAAHPSAPWTCAYCGKPITELGKHSDSLHIHHVDEDVANNELTNLQPMHFRCHRRHHALGKTLSPMSDATKAKLRAANLGKTHSPETRAKIGAISKAQSHEWKKGRKASDETRAKIRAAAPAAELKRDRQAALQKNWATRRANQAKQGASNAE